MATKKKKENPFPDFKAKDKRELIGNLVVVSRDDYKNPVFWSREMKLINELLSIYPNPKFLQSINLGFKLNSLAWFKMKDGKERIRRLWNVFNYSPKEKEKEIILEDKVGESIISETNKSKQTIMEFLDG